MNKTMNYWTDDDLGLLLDESIPIEERATRLGRTVTACQQKRWSVNAGRSGLAQFPWTSEELDVLRATLHMRAKDVMPLLPGRTSIQGVVKERRLLAEREDLIALTDANDPNRIGLRRLVAKTCLHCGVLMDASWFRRNQKAGCWTSKCTACRRGKRSDSEVAANRARVKRNKQLIQRSMARFQELTTPAENSGKDWTTTDHDVLGDPDLTLLEKALQLKRSYKATAVAASRSGYTSRVGLGDKNNGVWNIEFPERKTA